MVSTVNDTFWLEWINRLMGAPAPAARPLDRSCFYCLLDDQPSHLVPRRFVTADDSIPGELVYNPSACICRDGDLPPSLRQRSDLVARFDLAGPVVWVSEPVTDTLQPFWLGSELQKVVADFIPGERVACSLSPPTRAVLYHAGLLVTPDHAARRRKQWSETTAGAARTFSRGFASIAALALIHPYHLAALRRYIRYMIRNRQVPLGDGQSSLRYVLYNDPVLRFFHHQLTPALCDIAGEMLKPSYAYMASYLAGSELARHTDRRQCEFTLSLLLDFAPEPALETPWPIHLDTVEGTVTVFQGIGDALLFRGRDIPHYRDVFTRGTTSTSVFFHYVKKSFEGELN